MKICVIGAGNIGRTLGGKWARKGHEVIFGVRDPEAAKVRSLLAELEHGAQAAAVPEGVARAEVVLFAIPGKAMAETVGQLGSALNGAIVIDATNNVGQTSMHQLGLLREAAADSALFRAFSSLGWENFANPVVGGQQVDLFYCGDEGPAKAVVEDLIAGIGLRPLYVGGVAQADLIDALTRLWFNFAMGQGYGRRLAFKMVTD